MQLSSHRRIARFNARQRKKHHVGEFQELGFTLNLVFSSKLNDLEQDAFMDILIAEVERLQLAYGGSVDSGFVTSWERGSVTLAQRDELVTTLQTQPAVHQVNASELLDAWYDLSWVETQ